MAGPLNGIGGSGQFAAYSAAQSQQNNQQIRRPEERDPQENRVQSRNAAAADSQNSETGNQGDAARTRESGLFSLQSGNASQRGGLLDITV